MKIQDVLKAIDKKLNEKQPKKMDELINIVHSIDGNVYGGHFTIVKYKGFVKGVRVYVTGRNKKHCLPAKNKFYSVCEGFEKFEAAGWQIENETDN